MKKSIAVESRQELFGAVLHPNHDWTKNTPGKAQFLKFGNTILCNFHGLWVRDIFKQDNQQRLEQSKQIRTLLNNLDGEKIICGDFNIVTESQSIAILEKGMRNLIKEFNITSTRSSHYTKDLKFADYILVSAGIKVKDFKVLQDEVSDHLALMLNFENRRK